MGAILRFPAARASDAEPVRDFAECETRKRGTIATLSSTLDALTAALATIAEQIAALPEGTARMELTVQHLHLNLAAFKARQAIADLDRVQPDRCPISS